MESAASATQRMNQRVGGGRRNWKGENSLRTPLALSRIGSGKLPTDSVVRDGCRRTDETVCRKLVVIRDARLRDGVARECAGAAAVTTALSAHSAVATTITAITCLVLRIGFVTNRSARVLRCRQSASRRRRRAAFEYYPVRPALVRPLAMARRRIIWYSYRELGVYVDRD